MKKKGFTLVELLAVIAILAIIVLMALPAILRMFRQARITSFENEVKAIYKQAQSQIVSDSLNLDAGGEKVYASDITTTTTTQGTLELQGGDKIKYCVVLDNSGNIKKLYVSNGTYMYMSESPNALKNIENIEAVDITGEDFITGIENCMETESAMFDVGENVNIKMKQLANPTATNITSLYIDTTITAIKKSDTEPTSANKEVKNKVSSTNSDLDIYMWFEDGVIYWWSEDNTPSLNADSSWMFNRLTNLTDISGLSTFDASNVTTMFAMFLGKRNEASMKLLSLKALSNWNVSNVTNMQGMFQANVELTTLEGLENWDVSNVTTFGGMFNCYQVNCKLTTLKALSNWDVSNVESMIGMFQQSANIKSLEGLENWDVSNVKSMAQMFSGDTTVIMKISSLQPLSNWDVSNVTDINGMFYSFEYLTTLEGLENWDTSKVENMYAIFYNCSGLTTADNINFWNINSVTNFDFMFGLQNNNNISTLNPVHPTFKYLDEQGIEHNVTGSWNSRGDFVKE